MEILDKGSKTVAVLRTRFNTVYRQEGREKWRGGKGKMRIKKEKKGEKSPVGKRNPRGTGRAIDLQRHPSIVASQWTPTYAPAP